MRYIAEERLLGAFAGQSFREEKQRGGELLWEIVGRCFGTVAEGQVGDPRECYRQWRWRTAGLPMLADSRRGVAPPLPKPQPVMGSTRPWLALPFALAAGALIRPSPDGVQASYSSTYTPLQLCEQPVTLPVHPRPHLRRFCALPGASRPPSFPLCTASAAWRSPHHHRLHLFRVGGGAIPLPISALLPVSHLSLPLATLSPAFLIHH